MTIEDTVRSQLPRLSEDVPAGPSLEAALVAGRSRRRRRHIAAGTGSAAAVAAVTLVAALLLGGGSESPHPSGHVAQAAAPPRSDAGAGGLQEFEDFVPGSQVDESMQAVIAPYLPVGADATVTDVYPSDWTRNTPLPDAQAENATDWQAVYSLVGGDELRVTMGLPVPYEERLPGPCGDGSDPTCSYSTRDDGAAVQMIETVRPGEHVATRLAVITLPDGFVTTAADTIESAGPDGTHAPWSLDREQLVALADADGLTFPAPVVTPPTQAPDWMD